MKYLCLVAIDEKKLEAMSKSESEQIGGFILMEAKDLNEAIQLASKIPVARMGTIEVRPIKELKQP